MNRQSYALLFAALLASTFVHELRAKSVAPARLTQLDTVERTKRDTTSTSTSVGVGLTLQVVSELVIIANSSDSAALLVNVSASVFVLLNGTDGSGIIIDNANNNGCYISKSLWNSSSESLEDFVGSLTGGIESLSSTVGGQLFLLSAVPKSVLQQATYIISCLVVDIENELERDLTLGLNLVITIVKELVADIKGNLNGLLDLVGDATITLATDISGLINILKGLQTVVVAVAGNLTALLEADVELKLALILGAVDGLVCLTYILDQIVSANTSLDLSALAVILNDRSSFFSLVASLGGNVTVGISGIIKVLVEIVGLINGENGIDTVIGCIIQYIYSTIESTDNLTATFNAELNSLLTVLKEDELNNLVSTLIADVEALIAGTLTVGGIALSSIVTLLLGIGGGVGLAGLTLLVKVVLLLDDVVAASTGVLTILVVLICKLNSALGISQIVALGIGIKVNVLSITTGLLKGLLTNISSILGDLLTNLYKALTEIVIVKDIVSALVEVLADVSSGIVLKNALASSTSFTNLIKAIFQLLCGVSLNESSSVLTAANATLTNVTSVKVYVNVDIQAVVSASL